jgi:SAM-dependent methyltransferase
MTDRPAYDAFTNLETRSERAEAMAHQVLSTCRPWLPAPEEDLVVLDLGSGYGGTALALSRRCRRVVALEPAEHLHRTAVDAAAAGDAGDIKNLEHRHGGVETLRDEAAFDLVVLDNVYEHLPDHDLALTRISAALRPGGAAFVLVPNRLWPIEAHYRLPFLSWLPLPLADRYLRWSGRGTSYEDASYAPTYWSLRRELAKHPELTAHFVLPHDPAATMAGTPVHYRWGMAALRRWPSLWAISKALLVVVVKAPQDDLRGT